MRIVKRGCATDEEFEQVQHLVGQWLSSPPPDEATKARRRAETLTELGLNEDDGTL